MKKFSNKGFVLAETIIVAVFMVTIFSALYTNYFPLMANYEKREYYLDSFREAYRVVRKVGSKMDKKAMENIKKKINEKYNCETFAKIEETSVKVVVDKCENSKKLANNIMRLVQEQFENIDVIFLIVFK